MQKSALKRNKWKPAMLININALAIYVWLIKVTNLNMCCCMTAT